MTPDEVNARIAGFFPDTMGMRFTVCEPRRIVAVVQAYVFALLTCIYLNDSINLH